MEPTLLASFQVTFSKWFISSKLNKTLVGRAPLHDTPEATNGLVRIESSDTIVAMGIMNGFHIFYGELSKYEVKNGKGCKQRAQ